MKIKVLIADDEKHARTRLKKLLKEYEVISHISEASSGDEVLKQIVSQKPDVVFLDINMPGTSVFSTIHSLKSPPLVIFQTAHSEYAVEAFKINAVDYLLKPVSNERFVQTMNKIQDQFEKKNTINQKNEPVVKGEVKSISIKINDVIKIININHIIKITFIDGVSHIYTNEGKFLSDKYLNHYEKILKSLNFFRANRNELINIDQIVSMQSMFNGNYVLELRDGTEVALSRRRVKELKEIIDY